MGYANANLIYERIRVSGVLSVNQAGGSLPLNGWSNEGRDRGYAIELSSVVSPVVAGQDGVTLPFKPET